MLGQLTTIRSRMETWCSLTLVLSTAATARMLPAVGLSMGNSLTPRRWDLYDGCQRWMNLDDNMQVVYNAVLRANRAVLAACAPGVVWSDMHLLANRFVITKCI